MFSSSLGLVLFPLALALHSTWASPLGSNVTLERRQNLPIVQRVTPLTTAQTQAIVPYVNFARQTYCPMMTGTSCGVACTNNRGFDLTLHGGDGNTIQIYYVGYWPQENAVVIAHQGTESAAAWMVDADAQLVKPSTQLYPGVPSEVLVHHGFYGEQVRAAPAIMPEVKKLISQHNAKKVISTGHSLGAGIAELDGLYFRLNLPKSIAVKAVTFGTPRVGNQAYANFYDSKLKGSFFRINHGADPVAVVPPTYAAFKHPTGEIHFPSFGGAVACPGQDDATDAQCQVMSSGLMGNMMDHMGPYAGVYMYC